MWKRFLLSFLILLAVVVGNFVVASEEIVAEELNEFYHINLDQATIAKGYTVSSFEDSIKLSLVPGILSEATGVDVVKLNETIDLSWKLEKLSNIYQFEFQNKEAYDDHKPFYIQFSYEDESDYLKQVYFFDKNYSTWRPLPTRDYPDEKFVRSLIHLPFARIAVFVNPDVLAIGQASWYGYKGIWNVECYDRPESLCGFGNCNCCRYCSCGCSCSTSMEKVCKIQSCCKVYSSENC
jgi:hypothetical protein